MKRIFLVTGAAGFIGAALVQRLLKNGEKVIGVDNMNNYYDIKLKEARLSQIEYIAKENQWNFYKISIDDSNSLLSIFEKEKPRIKK